jgi:hypothetical protein
MPALLALTFTVHIRFRRQIHDFNQLRPGGFASPPQSDVVGIAGDPQLRQPVTDCRRNCATAHPESGLDTKPGSRVPAILTPFPQCALSGWLPAKQGLCVD